MKPLLASFQKNDDLVPKTSVSANATETAAGMGPSISLSVRFLDGGRVHGSACSSSSAALTPYSDQIAISLRLHNEFLRSQLAHALDGGKEPD